MTALFALSYCGIYRMPFHRAGKCLQGFSDMRQSLTEMGGPPAPIFGLPDLVECERVDNYGQVLVLRAFTANRRRVLVPLSSFAARSLLAAVEKEDPFQVLTGIRPVSADDWVKIPVLSRFVCYRAMSPD